MEIDAVQVENVDSTSNAEVTTDAELDIFDTGWDGDGLTANDDMELEADETTEESAEADQQTAEETESAIQVEEPDTTEETAQIEDEAEKAEDQRFVLKHLDEEREVNRDEVIVLAQKGMDYDRKTGLLTAQINEYEEFFKELMPEGLTIEQFMDVARAKILKAAEEKEGREISESDALLKVQNARAEKKAAAKAAAKQEADTKEADAKRKNAEAIQRFVAEYPNMKAEDIPQSVWDDAKKDGDLLGAYNRFELKKLRAENAALKQNEKNKARSTGSRKTEGAANAKDPFDAAWDAF